MKISIVIPVYNEPFIANCVNSILRQATENVELILVDDGSREDFKEQFLRIYEGKKGIKVLHSAHRGPAAARNLGCKEASGEVVIFTDSDCEADGNWLSCILQPLEKDGSIVGVQGIYKTRQEELLPIFVQCEINERYDRMKKGKFIDFLSTYSCAYQKRVLEEVNYFDESFTSSSQEDTDLSFRVEKRGHKMMLQPSAITYHRHPKSIREYFDQKFRRGFWRIPVYRRHKRKVVLDSYTPQTLKVECVSMLMVIVSLVVGLLRTDLRAFYAAGFLLAGQYLLNWKLLKCYYHKVGLKFLAGLWYISVRNLALTLGAIFGFLHLLGRKNLARFIFS